MAAKLPYKVQFHYDSAIGSGEPINGTKAHREEVAAHSWAKSISRNGGTATVKYRDPITGKESVLASYAPEFV